MTGQDPKTEKKHEGVATGGAPAPSGPLAAPASDELPSPSDSLLDVEEETEIDHFDGSTSTDVDAFDQQDTKVASVNGDRARLKAKQKPFAPKWFKHPEERATKKIDAAVQQTHDGKPPVVLFAGVSKTYALGTPQAFTAINDVNFVVEDLPGKGEFVAILGPSGCGKSTVLRMIAGLDPQFPPTTGRIEVFGHSIAGPGADRGMVFQSYTSFDHRTVLHNVAFGLECRGVKRRERLEEARHWIDKVGLSVKDDANKYPHQLSGGMQQRVAIARTLILKPRIILMDEPFGALDPITRLHMQDQLIALWREVEATVFFVTHSIEESVYLGDRVYIFSASPGTIDREIEVPPPDRPAIEMQRDGGFQQVVFEIREIIDRLETEAQSARRGGGKPAKENR